TFSLLAASVLLFFAAELSQSNDGESGGRRAFGAVEGRRFEVEVSGPFDLWNGPWWRWVRIPTSAFHHANLLHLFCNVSTLWFLGPLMERRMRRAAYLGFWFFSATVPLVPEYYFGNYPIGLSGVACAMFGWCLIERQYDSALARRLDDRVVRSFWMFLFLFLGLSAIGWLPIANVAHFVGVGYGWLNARASRHRNGRMAWIAAHALLPLAIYGVLHPFWNARYHAFLGRTAQNADGLSAGVPHFREAVRRDPGLPKVWLSLAVEQASQGDHLSAWKLTIEGLQHNRSSEELAEFARTVWRFLPEQDQEAGREVLRLAFVEDAPSWSKNLRMAKPSTEEESLGR
ncbi:MAG: rhomboid family intramembrane serine protease, partial [Planctomycetaceae bacterium]|nr:rhomboid family intramembrane serine protease [Planctomycetaceae bacterium]